MNGENRKNPIKRLQTEMPRGVPFDLSDLRGIGVSAQLASQYVAGSWIKRLGHGVYAFPNDSLDESGALEYLQKKVVGLHVGGKSALAMQGILHNLGRQTPTVLWGDVRFTLPAWYMERFNARYVYASLFDWPDKELDCRTLHTPPGQSLTLVMSVPERAVLELLYEVGTRESLEEARNVFDGLRSPRKKVLGQLLGCCTSVKAVRLFLTWARQTGVIDVDAFLEQYPVRSGSNKRWISRLNDGTTLSLNPHG